MGAWKEFVHRRKVLAHSEQQVATRQTFSLLRATYMRWRFAARAHRAYAARVAAADQTRDAAVTVRFFTAWRAKAAEKVAESRRIARAEELFRRATARRALAAWFEYMDLLGAQRAALTKVMKVSLEKRGGGG